MVHAAAESDSHPSSGQSLDADGSNAALPDHGVGANMVMEEWFAGVHVPSSTPAPAIHRSSLSSASEQCAPNSDFAILQSGTRSSAVCLGVWKLLCSQVDSNVFERGAWSLVLEHGAADSVGSVFGLEA
jgi:hypothetical protein